MGYYSGDQFLGAFRIAARPGWGAPGVELSFLDSGYNPFMSFTQTWASYEMPAERHEFRYKYSRVQLIFFFKKILFCLRQGGQIACTIESIECFGTKVQKNAGINAGISVHLYDGALGKAEFAAELPVPIKLCKPAP